MKFLVDAQLPARLARALAAAGHDTLHTTDLANGNRTSDDEITAVADNEDRVVITKDRDFRDSHLLRRTPRRLLVVATGNISNDELLATFKGHLDLIVDALTESNLVEITAEKLIVHADRPADQ